MGSLNFEHTPVLLEEVLKTLRWDEARVDVADLTIGGGGHLRALLESSSKPNRVVACDQDLTALEAAKRNLSAFNDIEFHHLNFRDFKTLEGSFDRIFLDLGVSSHQLDEADRGFSFQKEGPLDMRMDPSRGEPIIEWLMRCDEKTLAEVFEVYGEDPYARKVARKWVEVRFKKKVRTTREFVEALGFSLDSKVRGGRHPLTRVFQALRIQANDEIGALREVLEVLPEKLRPGGRLGILTFHSLEDREVKWGLKGRLEMLTKKPLVASESELHSNPRARSAKLRVYVKS